jgi:hypothetical protein
MEIVHLNFDHALSIIAFGVAQGDPSFWFKKTKIDFYDHPSPTFSCNRLRLTILWR